MMNDTFGSQRKYFMTSMENWGFLKDSSIKLNAHDKIKNVTIYKELRI